LQRIRFETYHGKEVGAQNAARLAEAMKADGVLVTWIGGGNAFVDVMFPSVPVSGGVSKRPWSPTRMAGRKARIARCCSTFRKLTPW
jgi:hypothetical protein